MGMCSIIRYLIKCILCQTDKGDLGDKADMLDVQGDVYRMQLNAQ